MALWCAPPSSPDRCYWLTPTGKTEFLDGKVSDLFVTVWIQNLVDSNLQPSPFVILHCPLMNTRWKTHHHLPLYIFPSFWLVGRVTLWSLARATTVDGTVLGMYPSSYCSRGNNSHNDGVSSKTQTSLCGCSGFLGLVFSFFSFPILWLVYHETPSPFLFLRLPPVLGPLPVPHCGRHTVKNSCCARGGGGGQKQDLVFCEPNRDRTSCLPNGTFPPPTYFMSLLFIWVCNESLQFIVAQFDSTYIMAVFILDFWSSFSFCF